MNIVIVGDSWGCGEWGQRSEKFFGEYVHVHPGLELYLKEDGHNVLNFSKGGSSNSDITYQLKCAFNSSIFFSGTIDKIFMFQTEWIRDIRNQPRKKFDINAEVERQAISEFYNTVSNIAVENNTKVGVIGGCSDAMWTDDFEKQYPNLYIICQSFINLCVTGSDRIDDPIHFFNCDLIEQFSSADSDKEYILKEIERIDRRKELLKCTPELFWPDTKHANRHGHWILYEYIKKNFIEN